MDLRMGATPPPFHHLPSACSLHPEQTVMGFCASCLRERLAGIEAATGRRSSALRSVFARNSASNAPSLLRPELRRCKSFSIACRPSASTSALEPERMSCDARDRYTLWSLFRLDDLDDGHQRFAPSSCSPDSAAVAGGRLEARPRDEVDETNEIRAADPVLEVGTSLELDEGKRTEVKPMKDHIDRDAQPKKASSKDLKEIAGSFLLAASIFGKKFQKWRRNQKDKERGGKGATAAVHDDRPPTTSRRRDTQSEVAIDGFGRRSCDTDPRFSLDAGRMSLDDSRFSLDEPRASWDRYLTGGRPVFARFPPMLAVVEDGLPPAVLRSDGLIPVEDAVVPGGSAQTWDYYLDSSSCRRRRSLDRSNSKRNSICERPVEFNELKPSCDAEVSPASGTEFLRFYHTNLLVRDSRDLSSKSLRDEFSGSLCTPFTHLHEGATVKKPRKWSKAWNIWKLIQGRSNSRGGANVVDRSFSETWPGVRSEHYIGGILRSNSNVSSRSSFSANGSYKGPTSLKTNGYPRKKREEFVLYRNRSARYSPNHVDNGMLRFYLTPFGNSRRNGGSRNGRHINSQYSVKDMLGFY